MLIAGLVVSRVIVETAHAHSKKADAQVEYQARLLSQINDAVIATDDQFHITMWNQGAEKLYGWSATEALGRNLTDLIQSDMTSAERTERLKQLLHGNSEYQLALAQYHKDGQPVYIEANTTTIYDAANGRVTGLLSVNRDITERKQAEDKLRESETQYKNLFENMPMAIFTKDIKGRYLSSNLENQKFWDRSEERV